MAITHASAVRDAIANLIDDQVNGGSGDTGGDIVLRDSTTILVEIEFSATAFGAASSGTITAADVPLAGVAGASGEADNFQIRNKSDTVILSGSVTAAGGGGDIQIDNINIASSQDVILNSLTYSAPT